MKVLLIEDNTEIIDIVSITLKLRWPEVTLVSSFLGKEGIELVKKELPDIVNFYSKPIVDKIGREKLLSAPARKVEELENGGIMLLVCTEQLGCPDELDRVRLHLGYG